NSALRAGEIRFGVFLEDCHDTILAGAETLSHELRGERGLATPRRAGEQHHVAGRNASTQHFVEPRHSSGKTRVSPRDSLTLLLRDARKDLHARAGEAERMQPRHRASTARFHDAQLARGGIAVYARAQPYDAVRHGEYRGAALRLEVFADQKGRYFPRRQLLGEPADKAGQ